MPFRGLRLCISAAAQMRCGGLPGSEGCRVKAGIIKSKLPGSAKRRDIPEACPA